MTSLTNASEVKTSSGLTLALVCVFISLITILSYWQVAHNDFLTYDDADYVTANKQIQQGITVQNLRWALTAEVSGNWHPITLISHMIDCQFFGLNPEGHHLVNLFIHMANSLILFLLFARITGNLFSSSVLAILFAIHPAHVESVAWIAERKDVLSTLFFLLTLSCYTKYIKSKGFFFYFLVLLFFAAGLMTKPMVVTLPFVVLLMDNWPLERLQISCRGINSFSFHGVWSFIRERRLIFIEKIPFSFPVLSSCMITIIFQKKASAVATSTFFPIHLRLGNAVLSYVKYMIKLLWPFNLAVFYPYPESIPLFQVFVCLAIILFISFLSLKTLKTTPWFAVGWFWYLGTMIPVIGFVQVGAQSMADRYTYIPSIGLFIIISWGVPYILKGIKNKQIYLIASFGTIVSILAIISWIQVNYWKNSETLFAHALTATKNNYFAHNALANIKYRQNDLTAAANNYGNAILIKPNYLASYIGMGLVLEKQGKTGYAENIYEKALKIDPAFSKARVNLGVIKAKQGFLDDSIQQFKKALFYSPGMKQARQDLFKAIILKVRADEKNDNIKDAILHLKEAIGITPNNSNLYVKLGRLYIQIENIDLARRSYEKALSINNIYMPALNGLAMIHAAKNDYRRAISLYKKMIALNPSKNKFYYNIACLYARNNKPGPALNWLQMAMSKGYSDISKIKADKDLDSIKNTLEYRAMIRQFSKRG